MIDPQQFTDYIIKPALKDLYQCGIPYTKASVKLVLGTAIQESLLTFVKQLNDGPAMGFFQMEPATFQDIFDNYLKYNPKIHDYITRDFTPNAFAMVGNVKLATEMCRIHYYRRPEPLPDLHDDLGMAKYWKQHYNTPLGKGTVDEYLDNWAKYGAEVKL